MHFSAMYRLRWYRRAFTRYGASSKCGVEKTSYFRANTSKVSTSQLTTHVQHVVERIVVAREHRQNDGGRWLGTITTIVKCQTATDERASQPWKSTLWRTSSLQCRWQSTGVIVSERRVPVTRQAAAFWTECNRFISPSEMPKRQLQ